MGSNPTRHPSGCSFDGQSTRLKNGGNRIVTCRPHLSLRARVYRDPPAKRRTQVRILSKTPVPIAQLTEQRPLKAKVAGLTPARRTSPSSPTAEAAASKPVQSKFESWEGYLDPSYSNGRESRFKTDTVVVRINSAGPEQAWRNWDTQRP